MKRQTGLQRLGLILMLLAGMVAYATSPRGETLATTSVVTVNSTTDVSDGDTSSIANLIADPGADGVISLREAMVAANSTGGTDTINFDIPGSGVHTIAPASPLPDLNDSSGGTTIDGYSQPGATEATGTTPATLKIVIDGSSAGATNGFNISQTGHVIKGLVINNFERNGIYISGLYANGNVIAGNYIGTDASGTTDQGNGWCGIEIYDPAQNNTIGGDTPGERNVISGNNTCGVYMDGTDVMSTTVSANYIGTDASGTADLGNTHHGIDLYGGARNNTIGGTAPGERNVISGNDLAGVSIQAGNTMSNSISGNFIGTDVSGTIGVGNGTDGIYVSEAAGNTIGGLMGNVISGNSRNGITIHRSSAAYNVVSGNLIGLDLGGTTVISNTQYGIHVYDGAHDNTIGGAASGAGNVVSGNGSDGIILVGSGTVNNTIYGNHIGVDGDGVVALGNSGAGVLILNGPQSNLIGGTASGQGNIISGNGQSGVTLRGTGTLSNTVSGNYIGVGFDGATNLGNAWHGVEIRQSAQSNTIGPDNVIAHSGLDGVDVEGSSTSGHTITRNSIFANLFGIDLTNGANGSIPAPVITAVSGSVDITGTACPGCTVEVFENADDNGEGESYLGSTTATVGGAFTLTVASLNEAYLTATATDVVSGTSEFSSVFVNRQYVYLPLVLQNSQ